ncbi:bifunctional non-homologous end joining protein LigD [Pseudoxanthobacter soli DSM 19599]|uniref:DNA ligase (ATP) n=1 Tax=Pseudoxanthobacter soli DSM 19599 TaxID=1123029 RepID=A0A1M7ZPK8_9HYPH|nr:DNA ligase D [Pseudoxanthobacter soli]SHO66844.1 bifunctional non-homologous end joining protein LigD [Pseudoxanthobacter soli DSM 19599]
MAETPAPLERYRRKRDFDATPEPRGGRTQRSRTKGAASGAGGSFVVQKHDARRLHYDFRLEMDGVLKSWAVTRGPSLVPGEKRLAVHVEDHPLDYGGFEGTIPKGQYGGGTVIVWDRGTWTPIGDPHKAYKKGHLEFELHGDKLAGRWHLVRMHGKPGETRENWLLIKGEDAFARTAEQVDVLEERPESVKTGRTIAEVADAAEGAPKTRRKAPGKTSAEPARTSAGKTSAAKTATTKTATTKTSASKASAAKAPAKKTRRKAAAPDGGAGADAAASKRPDSSALKGAREATLPDFVPPALATLVAKAPSGARWLHEIKFDGYRLEARIENGKVSLLTRSGLDWTEKFGADVVAALKALPAKTALIDGEMVVENDAGASDFSALQADLSAGRNDRFVFYAFDLLHLDGYDLTGAPLSARKDVLARLLPADGGKLRYSQHFEESGALVLQHACRLSLEGVVSKDRDAPYRSGRGRAGDKATWVKSKCSARQEFVIGGYVPSSTSRRAIGSLVLGVYDDGELRHVGRVGTGFSAAVAEDLFRRLEPMARKTSPFAGRLTAEESRHARFVEPELVAEVEFRAWTADHHLRHASFRGLRDDKPAREIVEEKPAGAAGESAPGKAATVEAAPAKPPRRSVRLTHPDRLYWPDAGVTKEGLADYYTAVWRSIAPFIVGRPLALLRCPEGITGPSFFQKHAWKGIGAAIRQVQDPKDKNGQSFLAIDDLDGLIGLVQSAVLEIHPWGSTLADWERPDTLTMDLDPGEGVPWDAVIEAARETKARLEQAGLAAFVKTSGGKGLHVVSPLKPKAEWPAIKAFAKGLADAMAADSPDRYVATITKSKRRGKILVDYLRNQRGMTAVAPYSTRARPGAPVSMPLTWEELDPNVGPAYFTVANTPTRLTARGSDPWEGFRAAAAPVEPRG